MGKEERFNYYINKKDDRDWFIGDSVKQEEITSFKGVVEVLNQQSQRIAELEEQLANSIRPKFKVNDDIFVIVNDKIEEYYIDEVLLKNKGTLVAYRDICKETTITEKNELFATKEEAQAKLEELKGGKNE